MYVGVVMFSVSGAPSERFSHQRGRCSSQVCSFPSDCVHQWREFPCAAAGHDHHPALQNLEGGIVRARKRRKVTREKGWL